MPGGFTEMVDTWKDFCSRRTLPRTDGVILKSGLWEPDHLLEGFLSYFWLNTVSHL